MGRRKFNEESFRDLCERIRQRCTVMALAFPRSLEEYVVASTLADLHLAVRGYIGILNYDGTHVRRSGNLNFHRKFEIVDMVRRHWNGGVCLPAPIIDEMLDAVLENWRQRL